MRYTSLTGTSRTGTVWSPGPIANSLWVLDDETGEPVVVKVPKGDVSAAHELGYATPALIVRYDRPVWSVGDGSERWHPSSTHEPANYRYAPALPEKVWRAAVGNQCEQLALTAA